MVDLKKPGRVTRSAYSHPLTYLLGGGIPLLLVLFEYVRPSTFFLWLGGMLIFAVAGIIGLFQSNRGTRIALVLLGAGLLGMYGLVGWLPEQRLRDQVQHQTIHLQGEYRPGGTILSSKINNQAAIGKFYLSPYNLPSTVQASPDQARSIRLTADVSWPHDHAGFSSYLDHQGYAGVLNPRRIHELSPARAGSLGIYRKLKQGLVDAEPRWPRSASFLRALVLGDKQGLDDRDRTVLKRLGIIHLFVISGLHVGLFFGLVYGLFGRMAPGIRLAMLTVLLGGYLHFLSWPVSATRAGVMLLLWHGMVYLDRRTSPWSYLWTAVLVMILWEPAVVRQVGFQLTVSAVIGIYAVMDYVRALRGLYGLDFAVMCTGAFFGVMPVVLYHFHYIPAAGLGFSFLAIYIFPVFLTVLGLQGILIGLDWTVPADFLELGFQWGMEWLASLASHRMDITVTGISPWTVVILAGGLWWMLDHTRSITVRALSLVLVLVILAGVIGSGISPHGELGLIQGEVPLMVQKSKQGTVLALIPPNVRIETYHVAAIGESLRKKGIRHVDYFLSDYPREVLHTLDPTFTVGRYGIHWRDVGNGKGAAGRYNFDKQRLMTGAHELHFTRPPDLTLRSYSPTVWIGYIPGQFCFVNRLEKFSDRAFEQLSRRACQSVMLKERSHWFGPEGRSSSRPPTSYTTEQWLFRLLRRFILV